ncbi:hypothetical protein K501DRAFT_278512 [Backusella circina FSU 941]|nr:hypothetical protein K501DRAFT_278512 [Backusella circina FSU 941]
MYWLSEIFYWLFMNYIDVETIAIERRHEFRAFIESAKDISLSCKKLRLCHCQYLPEVANLFPNLKYFAFKSVDENGHPYQNQFQYNNRRIDDFSGWHRHLKVLINFHIYNGFHEFLNTGVFQKLTMIALRYGRFSSESHTNVISSLKNAPYLQILQLQGFLIGYHDLSILHTNVTRLHTLILDHCSTAYLGIMNSTIFPPTQAMQRLVIISADRFMLDQGQLLRSMLSNYLGLKHLSVATSRRNNIWSAVYLDVIRSHSLATFQINTHIDIPNLVTELKENGMAHLKDLLLNLAYDELLQCFAFENRILDF